MLIIVLPVFFLVLAIQVNKDKYKAEMYKSSE